MTDLREALEVLADGLESTYPATFVNVGYRTAAIEIRTLLAAHPEQSEAEAAELKPEIKEPLGL